MRLCFPPARKRARQHALWMPPPAPSSPRAYSSAACWLHQRVQANHVAAGMVVVAPARKESTCITCTRIHTARSQHAGQVALTACRRSQHAGAHSMQARSQHAGALTACRPGCAHSMQARLRSQHAGAHSMQARLCICMHAHHLHTCAGRAHCTQARLRARPRTSLCAL